MARFCSFTHFLLFSFAAFLLASESNLIKAVPQSPRTAGVFMLIEGGKYTFNFTAARAACLFLNVTIATRAQVERALKHGLELCKYGWTAEQVAVIPRLKADKRCGQGKIGVVTWFASADKEFGVFCFNASDLDETSNRSTASPQSSTFPTTLTALTQPSTSATPLLRSTTKSPPSRKPITTKAPEQTSFTSAFTLLVKTTHSTRISSTSPTTLKPSSTSPTTLKPSSTSPTTLKPSSTFPTTLKPSSTHFPTSLSHLITSKPSVISLGFSTSSDFSVSSESVTLHLVSPAKPSPGYVPTALIILGIILLLLTAAGVMWYYKLNIFTFCSQGQQQNDDMETEMWKLTDSEMDLHSQDEGEEEEESDMKYSSDITLCVNPDIKTNS